MIGQLIAETTDRDFKEAVERARPKSWLKSVSAFANTVGGTLVFGVDDAREVVGLADAQADAEFVSQAIRDRLDPVPPFEIHADSDGVADVLVVRVEEGADTPYYYHADGRMEAYVRVGNRTEVADAVQLRDLALKGSNQTWDALDSGIPADKASFTVLRAAFYNRAGLKVEPGDLESFGLATDRGTLTNAGALLADEPLVRHSRVSCTRWGGSADGDFEDTDEYEGGLIFLLREAQAFAKRHTTESWEKTDDGRIERRSYSPRAVEEAVVNALIHRSYLELGSEVHIDMYDDRMTVRSPGRKIGKPLPEDVATEPVASKRRNPVIADVFHRLHYM